MADESTEKAAAKKPAASKAAATKADAGDKAPAKAPAKAKAAAADKAPAKAADKAPAKAKAAAKPAAEKAAKAEKPAAAKAAADAVVEDAKPAAKAAAKTATAKASAKKAEPAAKVSTLKMHHLRPAEGAHTKKTRVGRGEASKGKTAGRGTKGTGARYQVPAAFEGGQTPLHMRIPKLRGFKSPFKITYQVVNIDQIQALFPKGGDVTKAELVAKGAVRKNQPVKVLGDGEISVKVTIVDVEKVSQSAKSKIEAAGGSVNQG